MRHYVFRDKGIDPASIVTTVKKFLTDNGFQIDRESTQPNLWDLRASKRGAARIVLGAVRDADVVVAGGPDRFQVQFRLGVWGKDLVVPVVEGLASLGVTAAVDVHEERRLEEAMWRNLVQLIDPTLQVCPVCGAILGTPEDLRSHQSLEAERALSAQKAWERIDTRVIESTPPGGAI
jgi:hypothetical protein